MSEQSKTAAFLSSARPHLFRAVSLLFVVSFLLPFIDVVGCTTKTMSTFHGYQLFKGYNTLFFLAAILIFITYIVFSFYKRAVSRSLSAFGSSWRALTAALSGLAVWIIPSLEFLFDEVSSNVGQALAFVCAAAVFIDGLAISLRDYLSLRAESPGGPGAGPYRRHLLFHRGVIVFSLALVPVYFFNMLDEIPVAVIFFLTLSLPFALSELIVIQGLVREERWARRWTAGAACVAAAMAAFVVMSYL
ncbi:MAG: hypothetical protein JW807_16540 [Spirochaetes bacterium]|nr:hypothetical protein [Spirochaetota bacterium]